MPSSKNSNNCAAPPARHSPCTAIIICNLGSPPAATARALRPWLAEFLSDPRVVELPRILWLPILYGFVLPMRSPRSAQKYASIWRSEGSPLLHYSRLTALRLNAALQDSTRPQQTAEVHAAMRYGKPSLAHLLDRLQQRGIKRLVLLPAYPQYCGATTASVIDVLARWLQGQRHQPSVAWISDFHDHPAYIAALQAVVQEHWQQHGQGDYLLMSFHGVPQRSVDLGDPYQQHCDNTARLLAQALGLAPSQWGLAFQSRFGKNRWLGPATTTVIRQLAQQGKQQLQVVCPGFVADCLETLEELGQKGQEIFRAACAQPTLQRYELIPCLNAHPAWVQSLAQIVQPPLGDGIMHGN